MSGVLNKTFYDFPSFLQPSVIIVVVIVDVVPMADGGEVISSSLWHPGTV